MTDNDSQRTLLGELAARHAIADAVHRYCWAYDDHDLDALASLVCTDVVVTSNGRHEGADAALAFWRQSWEHVSASRHHVTNLVIEVDADRHGAAARSYFSSLSVVDGSPRLVLGRYHDRLRHDGHGWRFAEKVHVIDSVGPVAEGYHPREVRGLWP